ncbi:MAG: hypothetical protein CMO81_00720 [Waddliaceae bacterium]|nr:hypothetical protein [Waddliaceae bacterium]
MTMLTETMYKLSETIPNYPQNDMAHVNDPKWYLIDQAQSECSQRVIACSNRIKNNTSNPRTDVDHANKLMHSRVLPNIGKTHAIKVIPLTEEQCAGQAEPKVEDLRGVPGILAKMIESSKMFDVRIQKRSRFCCLGSRYYLYAIPHPLS